MNISLIVALTADGFIGRDSSHLADWTGKADKRLFVRLTREAGTVVMGSRTFATINRALSGRRTIVYTTRPEQITVPGVETTSESPEALVARLEREGATGLAIAGGTAVYTQFMQANLVDELHITIVPVVFGTGIRLFQAELAMRLQLIRATPLEDGAMYLHYRAAAPAQHAENDA